MQFGHFLNIVFMNRKKILALILLLDVCIMAVIFSVSGFYNKNVDAEDYVLQIERYVDSTMPTSERLERREFKPLYAVLGGSLVQVSNINAETAILVLNTLFFIGLSVSFLFFLILLGFGERAALIGTLWLIFGYPLLKYGLSIGTDISGWFFATFSAAIGLYGLKKGTFIPLVGASVFGFIGFLSKETGILGLGLVGFTALFYFRRVPFSFFLKLVLSISLPFLILETLFLWSLISKGSQTFFDWYKTNAEGIHSYQTIPYFIGIEGATFHILTLFAVLGLLFALRTKEILKIDWLSRYAPAFIISIPMLFWPIYITRIMYVQFLFMIPLALYGMERSVQGMTESNRNILLGIYTIIPIIISLSLFLLGHDQSLFNLFSI